MSELADSCEYLTSEKLCLAIIESEKARASRQVRCKNDEKTTCCYLCMFVLDCATPCHFLGNSENEPQRVEYEKIPVSSTVVNEQKPEEDETLYSSVTCCSLCNVEMFQTRTKFTIDGWKRSPQKLADDNEGKLGTGELPVTIYLCPKCGKIDFRADEKIDNK